MPARYAAWVLVGAYVVKGRNRYAVLKKEKCKKNICITEDGV